MHFFFLILLLGGPFLPIQLVPNPFKWSPNTVFYRYLSIGRSNKKFKKTKSVYFQILLLGGPSLPSQLVPNPFNWSPNTVFLQISQHRSLKSKKLKKQSPPPHPYWTKITLRLICDDFRFLSLSLGPQDAEICVF